MPGIKQLFSDRAHQFCQPARLVSATATATAMTHTSLALCLLLFAVSAAVAYDFHDTFFNEILADELEDWNILTASESQGRPRRSPSVPEDDDADKVFKCKHHYGKMCCGKGRWLKHFGDADKKTLTECFNSFNQKMNDSGLATGGDPFSCDRVNQMKMKVICTTECVGKKHNLIKEEDGSINTETVIGFLEKLQLESWQKPLLEEAVSKCSPEANSTSVTTPSTGSIKCNPVLLSLQHCIFLEVERNCPADQKKTEGKCKKLHDRIKTNRLF